LRNSEAIRERLPAGIRASWHRGIAEAGKRGGGERPVF